MGRHPDGERAWTPAEKQRRYRERKKNSAKAIPPGQQPVLLDGIVLKDRFQPDLITGSDVRQAFRNAMPTSQSKSSLKMPTNECCDFIAKVLSNGAKILEECGTWDTSEKSREFHWASLAVCIRVLSRLGWREVGSYPRAVNHNSPTCIFISKILYLMGIERKPSAVSEVLRGRRHINAAMNSMRSYEEVWAELSA